MRDLFERHWRELLFSCFLGVAAWQDIRRKTIDIRTYICFGTLAFVSGIFAVFNGFGSLMDMTAGAAAGGVLLILSRMTQGAVGDGDGWFFLISGICLGFQKNMELLMNGLFICGIACVVLWGIGMATGKSMRKRTVPFLPFLVPVWIGMIAL